MNNLMPIFENIKNISEKNALSKIASGINLKPVITIKNEFLPEIA